MSRTVGRMFLVVATVFGADFPTDAEDSLPTNFPSRAWTSQYPPERTWSTYCTTAALDHSRAPSNRARRTPFLSMIHVSG